MAGTKTQRVASLSSLNSRDKFFISPICAPLFAKSMVAKITISSGTQLFGGGGGPPGGGPPQLKDIGPARRALRSAPLSELYQRPNPASPEETIKEQIEKINETLTFVFVGCF